MHRTEKLNLLLNVIQGKADESTLKINKLTLFVGGNPKSRFQYNGKDCTLKEVFAHFYLDDFKSEVIKL